MRDNNSTISFYTIGCRLNQAESAVLSNSCVGVGFRVVDQNKRSDIAVINTCTVTEKSHTDCRRLVNRLIRLNPHVRIALIGCQAQVQRKALSKLPHVSWVIGNKDKDILADLLLAHLNDNKPFIHTPPIGRPKTFKQNFSGSEITRTRANLKVQDGCDTFCTYCEVPFARGRARSRELNDIVKEARFLAENGYQEIVLTGVNIGRYAYKNKTLLDIIKRLEKIEKLKRIRISSIEPTPILKSIVDHMAHSKKLCRYLHIPMQYGDDSILKSMRRPYTTDVIEEILNYASLRIPDICIGTDIIVGFPGETDQSFEKTYTLVKKFPIHYFHVFRYSDRPHARAKTFSHKVSAEKAKTRGERIRTLGVRKRKKFYETFIGKTVVVLCEQQKDNAWHGLTDNFLHVKIFTSKKCRNTFQNIKLTDIKGSFLIGKPLKE